MDRAEGAAQADLVLAVAKASRRLVCTTSTAENRSAPTQSRTAPVRAQMATDASDQFGLATRRRYQTRFRAPFRRQAGGQEVKAGRV